MSAAEGRARPGTTDLPFEERSGNANAPLRPLERPRFELVPVGGIFEAAAHLPPEAEVTVSCSPALGIENTLSVAEGLSERGFRAVPHVAARLVTGEAHLKRILRRMDEGGLHEAFVVGGDSKEPAGPFSGGAELLRAMSGIGHGIARVGVPVYPEPHPLIHEDTLTSALLDKQPFASYVVTQICFDPETILGWLGRIRDRGVELPVYIGVPGVVERRKLLGISLKIGLGPSVRYLRKQRGLAGRLTASGGYRPDQLISALSPIVGDPEYGIRGFHFNTFNQVEETERWRRGAKTTGVREGA